MTYCQDLGQRGSELINNVNVRTLVLPKKKNCQVFCMWCVQRIMYAADILLAILMTYRGFFSFGCVCRKMIWRKGVMRWIIYAMFQISFRMGIVICIDEVKFLTRLKWLWVESMGILAGIWWKIMPLFFNTELSTCWRGGWIRGGLAWSLFLAELYAILNFT